MEGGSEKRQGPAHARGRALPKSNEERLAELGKQLPPPSDDELEIIRGLRRSRLRRRLLAWLIALVLLALVAGGIAQWVRPLPSSALQVVSVRLPGTAPTFAWPSTGEAAASVDGIGALGQVNGAKAVPVAGLAEVLTAYVILSDHHLVPGADGPSIPVTSADVSAYQAGQASQESEVTLTAGESVTQLQALEGMLIDSGSDMATLLANWDAGSVGAFVAKMNAAAARLGMTSTHITDPSGVDPATTSTAEDLVRLGEAALTIPVLQQIVSLGEASVPIPGTTTVYSLNFDLGQDGIVGIDTGSDSSSQGCYLVAAQQTLGGKQVTVVGAVLEPARRIARPQHRRSRRRRHAREERLRRAPQLPGLRTRPEGGRRPRALGGVGARDRRPAGHRGRMARCHRDARGPAAPHEGGARHRCVGRHVARRRGGQLGSRRAPHGGPALGARGVVAPYPLTTARRARDRGCRRR